MHSPKSTKLRYKDNISIFTQFQPIISIKKKKMIGIEALSRGKNELTGEIIAPLVLFQEAANDDADLIELDRVCRECALQNYAAIKKLYPDLLLFLNIESSILDKVNKSNHLIDRVKAHSLNPGDIVIEINESRINEIEAMIEFVERYKNYGFIVALDDIGAGFSNLNRIPMLNPDIIKIDRFLLRNIHNNHFKKRIFKSLARLASRTGSLVVAEGVESLSEAVLAAGLGADMIQGFYFARPQDKISKTTTNNIISNFINKYKTSMDKNSKEKRILIDSLNCVSSNILNTLTGISGSCAEQRLKYAIAKEPQIECMYILNSKGIQISDTILKSDYKRKHKNVLFLPAAKGTDHSLKDYYYHLVANNNRNYISPKYMSMATGNMCITLSQRYINSDGATNILCIDFLAEY